MAQDKPTPRSGHWTQWAAQFAVASELCKRGYEVAFTMGNHPLVDIMVTSPLGEAFGIDVKGLSKKNTWAVRPKPLRSNLFYVLAFVPDDAPNRYFVLSQAQVDEGLAIERARAMQAAQDKGRPLDKVDAFPGIAWVIAEKAENRWDILPP